MRARNVLIRNRRNACAAAVCGHSLDSVYLAVSRSDNHCRNVRGRATPAEQNIPGQNAENGQNNNVIGMKKPGTSPGRWNEGVGEHVRTRSRPGFGPGEIAELAPRTERRKLVSSAGSVFER